VSGDAGRVVVAARGVMPSSAGGVLGRVVRIIPAPVWMAIRQPDCDRVLPQWCAAARRAIGTRNGEQLT